MSADLFNIYFADLEGLVDPNSWNEFNLYESQQGDLHKLSDSLRQLSNDITQLLRSRGRTESVFVGLAQSTSINGCCTLVDDEVYLVAINVGVLLRIRLLSQIFVEIDSGNKDLFTHHDRDWIYHIFGYKVVDNDSEKIEKISDSQEDLKLLLNAAREIKGRLKHSKFLAPIFAELYARAAFEFILLHELHHIAFGHLVPSNPTKRLYKRLWESGVNIQQEHHKIYQGIESCADVGAGKVAGLRFRERTMFFDPYPLKVTDDAFCCLLSCAVKLSLSIIAFDVSLLDKMHKFNAHPHPELRLFSFFDGVHAGIEERYPDVANNWRDGIAQGYWAITNAFQKLRILEPIAWSWTSNMQAWYDEIHFSKEVQVELQSMVENRTIAWNSCEAYFMPFLSAYRSR